MARKAEPGPPRARIPLAHRLPNPPSAFFGRTAAIEAIATSISSGPITIVCGAAGTGKSATVRQVVQQRFPEMVSRTLEFSVDAADPVLQLQLDLVQLLAELSPSEIGVSEAAVDPIELTQSIIDLAEEAEIWLVLENVHTLAGPELVELLTTVASYARKSRWIICSRARLRGPRLSDRVIELSPLSDHELTELAQSLRPELTRGRILTAVTAAAGSPWLLSRYLDIGAAGVSASREQLVEGLDPRAERFVAQLAVLAMPIPVDVLENTTAMPSPDDVAALERRGLITRTRAGYQAHDSVVSLFARVLSESERVDLFTTTAEALELRGNKPVHALHCWISAGAIGPAAAFLETQFESLLELGEAPRLWAAIHHVRDPRFAELQMKCAAEMGSPTALGEASTLHEHDPAAGLAWAETQYARGDVRGALATCTEMVEAGVDEAVTLLGRCLSQLRGAGPALAELARHPATPTRESLRLRLRAQHGETDLEADLAALRSSVTSAAALLDLAHTEHALGRIDDAVRTLERAQLTPRGGHASLLVGRMALVLKTRILVERGDARTSAELCSALEPFARDGTLLQHYFAEIAGMHAALTGITEPLGMRIERASASADQVDLDLARRVQAVREKLAVLTASDLSTPRVRARWGEGAATARDIGRAEAALLSGESSAAIELARAALDGARRRASTLDYVDASEVLLDALFIEGQPAGAVADQVLDHLDELARSSGSRRVRSFAALHRGYSEPAVLEACAGMGEITAARRARALLGAPSRLDRIDIAVVDVMKRASTLHVTTLWGDHDEWASGWGIDERHAQIWLPSGKSIDLSRKPLLLRLATHLVREGTATKEQLILRVWEERTYHSGRHDPRVHMTIRKLREAIEDDPSEPTRILTADSGYRVGGTVRWASQT